MSGSPRSVRNWAGNVTFAAARVHRPDSVEQLRRLVARAERIRALGSGHSFSLVADSRDELVRLDRLPKLFEIDRAGAAVTVGAGMRYAEITEPLHRAGFALANLASLPHISIAGSCATGTHGSGDTQRCLAAAVSGLRLVGPDGDLVELRRAADLDVFPGTVVALGGLGVVTALTLDIEPAFQVAQQVHLDVPLDEIAGGFDEVFGSAYSVSVFTDWRGGFGNVWRKRRLDRSEPAWHGGRVATAPRHPVPGLPADTCTEQLGVAGPWHERLPHFRPEFVPSAGAELQSEYFLPRTAADTAFDAMRGIADLVAPVLQIAEVRTVRGDELWLSPAYRRDTVTLHFTWVDELRAVLPVIEAVERALLPLGARPHWGKLTTVPPEQLTAGYPRAGDFALLLRKFDPDGKFANEFLAQRFGAANGDSTW